MTAIATKVADSLSRLQRSRPRVPRPPRPARRRRRRPRGEAVLYVVLGAIAVAAGTWLLGWWTAPALALLGGVIWFDLPEVDRLSATAAAIGWGLLLLFDALGGRVAALARALGGVLYLPWPLLILVTLLFAAGLAWSAATLGHQATSRIVKR